MSPPRGLVTHESSARLVILSVVQNLERSAPQYPIEAVERALRLLALFKERPELRLSDVRDHLHVGQSTAHRLMAMLVYHGFAAQDPKSRLYRAGPTLFEIGLAVVRNFDLRTSARPILEQLAATCGETVHLGSLEVASIRYIDCIESKAALRVGSRVGLLSPAHATSMGKAMLAALSPEAVRAIYVSPRLAKVTAKTVTRLSDLEAELVNVRVRGYAINIGEMEEGVCSVGAAVVHQLHGLVGAISLAAPISRVSPDWLEDHADLLIAAAKETAAAI